MTGKVRRYCATLPAGAADGKRQTEDSGRGRRGLVWDKVNVGVLNKGSVGGKYDEVLCER